MKKLKVSNEFVVGKHNIGYVNDRFSENFGSEKIEKVSMPTFQVLKRNMTDKEIESELKVSLCTVSDIYAFLENPPEGSRNGNFNLFYTKSFVVDAYWDGGAWHVHAWRRVDGSWRGGGRVFSPATETNKLSPSPSDSLSFDISAIKKQLERVYTELNELKNLINK